MLEKVREKLKYHLEFWEDVPEREDGGDKYENLPLFIGYKNLNETREILAELDAYMESNGWQTIETAPKDETYILVFQPDTLKPDITVVCWDDFDEWWHCCDGKNPELPLRGEDPTHWMPLPKSPSSHKSSER